MISKEMIKEGLHNGVVKLVADPIMESGTVCRIGELYFYFGGSEAEASAPEQYQKNVSEDDLVESIYEALESFRLDWFEGSQDEYQYYESYLKENDMKRRSLWIRLGIMLEISEEEGQILLGENKQQAEELLKQLIILKHFHAEGGSYIPADCISEYNQKYGTDFEVADREFEL